MRSAGRTLTGARSRRHVEELLLGLAYIPVAPLGWLTAVYFDDRWIAILVITAASHVAFGAIAKRPWTIALPLAVFMIWEFVLKATNNCESGRFDDIGENCVAVSVLWLLTPACVAVGVGIAHAHSNWRAKRRDA
jgi:hypothetical protein